MNIINALLRVGLGAVLADENNGVVRFWTLYEPFWDGRRLYALRRYFPNLEVRGPFLRLGGFRSLTGANQDLDKARAITTSLAIKKLFRFDLPETIATIKHI